jgi:hypothetical protein
MGLLLPLFASCGGNDTEDTPEPPEPEKKAVYVKYTWEDPGDMLKVFDVACEYTNEKGVAVKEQVATSPWSKTLSNISLPFKASLKITFAPRDNIPEQDQYRLGEGSMLQVYRDGEQLVDYVAANDSKATLTADNLEAGMARYGRDISYVVNIKWNGSTTESTPE